MSKKSTLSEDKKFYSLSQILLHWLIALLVFYQLAVSSGVEETYQIFLNTGEWSNHISNNAVIHIIIGFLILFGMLLRLYLRVKTKIPPLPLSIPIPLKLFARSSHFFIYFFLFLMPITGILGWFWELKFSLIVHTLSSKILLALILIHFCAAIFHEGVLGNKILHRMFQHKENSKH